MQDLIKEFMGKKRFAVIGASDNPEKYGNRIVKNLKARGYEVFPVNPRLKEVEGLVCFSSVADIPCKVDVAVFVVPPAIIEEVLKQCVGLGIRRIWLQPGSENEASISYCRENNLNVVYNVCVMMS
jgi:predicted CoA-binding protein